MRETLQQQRGCVDLAGPVPTARPEYENLLAQIESGEPGMHVTCPHCGHRATIRTSKAITRVTREAFCQCTNLACGHTFVAVMEIVRTISPSAVPDPLIASQLQQSQRAIEVRERERTAVRHAASG